jgi:alpha-beta hydrolase superfamily lysophospholipase
MESAISIPAGELELTGSLHLPVEKEPAPIIVICHGFIGSRVGVDRLFVQAAREFVSLGYAVLRFDYAGCGESPGSYGESRFDDLIRQTSHVIDYAEKLSGVDPHNIILLGHSLGGAVATHTAAYDQRIHRLILWSPVAYPFSDIVRIVGEGTYRQAKERQLADYHGFLFAPHFFDSMAEYFPLKDIRHFSGDVLVVHGSNDNVIPSKYCFYYQKASLLREQGRSDKQIVFGADHTYSNSQHREQLFAATANWISGRDRVTDHFFYHDFQFGI